MFVENTPHEDVLGVFDVVDGPVVTTGDVARELGCSRETARRKLDELHDRGRVGKRKTAGRLVYWKLDAAAPRPMTPNDPTFTDRPSFASGAEKSNRGPQNAVDADQPTRPADAPHREAATAVRTRVRDRLDDAIEALYLFGSVARGTATSTSDLDILAVVADSADYAAVDDQLLDIAYEVQLESEIPVEIHTIRAGEFAERSERGEPFVRAVLEEGEQLA